MNFKSSTRGLYGLRLESWHFQKIQNPSFEICHILKIQLVFTNVFAIMTTWKHTLRILSNFIISSISTLFGLERVVSQNRAYTNPYNEYLWWRGSIKTQQHYPVLFNWEKAKILHTQTILFLSLWYWSGGPSNKKNL